MPATILHTTDTQGLCIEQVNPLLDAAWDEDLKRYPEAGPFHTSHWARVLCETYGFTPYYLRAKRNGQSVVLLPLLEASSLLTQRRGISLPFTDDCPPLVLDQDAFRQVWQHALRLGEQRRWSFLECRGDTETLSQETVSTRFYGHRVPLCTQESALFEQCEGSVRRAIRKAEKSEVQIERLSSPEAMQAYYRLHCLTRKHHGMPPQSLGFFQNIQKFILSLGHGFILLAKHQGQYLAGAVFLHFNRLAVYKFGASSRDQLNLRPNNLIQWEAIRHYGAQAYTGLDFGRSSLGNEGLRQFKQRWGAQERLICYHRYDYAKRTYTTHSDLATGSHLHLFRHLPIWLSRMAGSLLYRHLA